MSWQSRLAAAIAANNELRAERDALAARLAAVEALHRPAHAIFNWQSGMRYEDPCPDCNGKAGVHPCGCWSDTDTEYVCRECHQPGSGNTWPCPTTRALATGTTTNQEEGD